MAPARIDHLLRVPSAAVAMGGEHEWVGGARRPDENELAAGRW
jgi:hypothetical protein